VDFIQPFFYWFARALLLSLYCGPKYYKDIFPPVADPGFLWGGCGGGLGPVFSEEMTPTFYGRFLARIGVARIFKEWMRQGVDPGFLVGDDGEAEGSERGAVGAKRRSAEGVGSEEGRRSPSHVWGLGPSPRKFLKFNLQICAFWCIFAPVWDAEFNATCSNFRSVWGVRWSSLGGGTWTVPPP